MTFYFRLLFISSFFLVSQQVAAQVELTTLTETTKPSAAKSAPLSPTVPVLDNSASIEQNFNATPITGEPNVSNPELERLIRQVSESQRRVEEYTKKAEEARVKADNDNKATQKEQEANKASQKAAEEEAKKQTELAAEQKKALESAQTAIKQKQDELNSVYQAELNKVKEQVGKNIPLFKAALASYDTSIDEIKQAQDKYWKTVPDVEDKTLLFESSQAQHEFAQQLAKLQTDQVTARASYERLTEQQVLLKNFKIDPAGPVKSEYNALLDNAQKASTETDTMVDKVKQGLQDYNKKVADWESTFKKKQSDKTASDNNLTTLPGLTNLRGSGTFIPGLTLLGSHRQGDDKSSNIYSVKVFTALGGDSKSSGTFGKRGTERLFIPEASTFGFSSDASFIFDYGPKHKSVGGVVVGASYLDKLMTPDSLTSFTTGVLTAHVGVQMFLVPDVLMVYGDLNTLTFLTSQAQVRDHYTTTRPKDVYGFTTVGARAIIKPDKSTVSLLFDLGFILKGDNVRAFVPNDDLVITTIRVTAAKNFALR